uniref:Uncharacterized protein n=1 Tax=Aegilops tauschii subsp. strangulata TaxID=200361 RepID=A0A453D772_AEGTS
MLPSAPADTSAARRSKIQARTRKNAARATSGSLGGGGGADMGRIPCCDKDNVKRGLWTPKEDDKLLSYITQYGTRNWRLIPKNAGESARGAPCRLGERNVRWLLSLALNEVALHCLPRVTGLQRCSKSCRVRWTNYMLPDLKHGEFTDAEEQTIIKLHPALGNRWSLITAQLPGRTGNHIENHWNTKLKKKLSGMGRPRGAVALQEHQRPQHNSSRARPLISDGTHEVQEVAHPVQQPEPMGRRRSARIAGQPAL